MNTQPTNQPKPAVAWGVYYVPNRNGRVFAGLKWELISAHESQDNAIEQCAIENANNRLDELHIGYRVAPMQWIPKGVTVQK